jgi:uncharacterized membrane protein YraQ (UPF0718 family)
MKGSKLKWYFLLSVFILYIAAFIINKPVFIKASIMFLHIFLKLIVVLVFIFILMVFSNYFLNPKKVVKYVGKEAGIKRWIVVVTAGILSAGSIYMWYPLLKDLKDKGMETGLIAAFLYNRAIKLHLIPLMILYFSGKFIFLLTTLMIIASIVQGIIINKVDSYKV